MIKSLGNLVIRLYQDDEALKGLAPASYIYIYIYIPLSLLMSSSTSIYILTFYSDCYLTVPITQFWEMAINYERLKVSPKVLNHKL